MPFYTMFKDRSTGHFIAAICSDAAGYDATKYRLMFDGKPVPGVICKAFIRQYGGGFRVCV